MLLTHTRNCSGQDSTVQCSTYLLCLNHRECRDDLRWSRVEKVSCAARARRERSNGMRAFRFVSRRGASRHVVSISGGVRVTICLGPVKIRQLSHKSDSIHHCSPDVDSGVYISQPIRHNARLDSTRLKSTKQHRIEPISTLCRSVVRSARSL